MTTTQANAQTLTNDVFVARQPIFDGKLRTAGYELLFRNGPQNFFPKVDGTYASSRLMHDSLHVFGLDALAPRQRVFINATRDVLIKELVRVLPPGRTTVEVLESVAPDEEVVRACQKLARDGYSVALDDFVFRPGYERLISVANIIKVDFSITRGDERGEMVRRFGSRALRLLAEKVETREEYDEAVRIGYSLFQGYFFAKPEMVTARDIPQNKLSSVRLLTVVNDRRFDFTHVEEVVKQDLSISIKLLRYLNSAAFKRHRKIDSIRQALVVLGEDQFRKWVSLVALSGMGTSGTPGEVVTTSLIRANFCEQVGLHVGLSSLSSFLVGLLSMVDVLLGRPIGDVLNELAIGLDVKRALLERKGPLAELLALAVASERGDWTEATGKAAILGIDEAVANELHARARHWTDELQLSASSTIP